MSEKGIVQASGCAARPHMTCEHQSLGAFPDGSGKVGRVEVVRCKYCGHGLTLPPIADVSFLYRDRQSQDFQPDATGISRRIKRLAFSREARKLVAQAGGKPTTVLDFGCGSGLFTRVLGDALPQMRVTGSDFHDIPPPELLGRPYRALADLKGEAGTFDLVLAMHVLEHEDDSARLLSQIMSMARPGGTLVIEVPNVDCVWARIFGKLWDAWYVPFHRTHFSARSLRHLLERAGMTIVAIHGATVPTFGRTFANIFQRRNSLFWLLAGIAFHPVQWLGEKVSRQPSALRIVARKP